MPALLEKHIVAQRNILRDVRPVSVRIADFWGQTSIVGMTMLGAAFLLVVSPEYSAYADFGMLVLVWYFRWAFHRKFILPFKFPKQAGLPDAHNPVPGKGGSGKSEGIMFIGNLKDGGDPRNNQELWITNTDTRTHILYLGTTGSGKTEGLKSLVTNALTWGSGFVYVDGKADTDLWAALFALARRFGRDDDLLVLNYMTANSDEGAVSNTMNPFANGSASYLSNMVTSLMPDAGGDNAMWKERAIALLSALMPALTWKRDKQGLLLDVGVLRDFIELRPIIALSRDQNLPERIIRGLQGYLNTLPGYIDAAFDDEGNERPPAPDQPMYDLQVARQQHGYLSMQFTRSLQSLADEYGYIFKAQLADIDVLDVVLNRRILVALIPALEKSGDEAANLGKIIAASLKGMMGATLGNTVEGSWEMAIGSKQTRSASSFMTVFDEVGYYTAQGMAVMAAQARSLGFSLVFAAQDLPSMEKRVKQEAQSILANCNLKIFGKIEDPMGTKEFLTNHAGSNWVMELNGMVAQPSSVSSIFVSNPYAPNTGTGSATTRNRVSYDHLRGQREGEAHIFFSEFVVPARMFYAKPDKVKALRVHKFLAVPGTTTSTAARERMITEIAARMKDPNEEGLKATTATTTSAELTALAEAMKTAREKNVGPQEAAITALLVLAKTPVTVTPPPVAEIERVAPPKQKIAAPLMDDYDDDDEDFILEDRLAQHEAPVVAAQRKVEAQATSLPIDQDLLQDRVKARSNLPPLQEGDQFAVTELEEFLAEAGVVDVAGGALPSRGVDIDSVTPPVESGAVDALATQLPPDVAELLQKSAEKLNQGLSGKGEE